MATREEIGVAIDCIRTVNRIGEALRNTAGKIITNENAKIQAIVDDPTNLGKLTAGLTALGVNVSSLNSDRNDVVVICNYVLANIPEIVKI